MAYDRYTLALVSAAVPLVFWLAMYFNRESPFYLILKGRTQQAREALLHLRGERSCVNRSIFPSS